MTNVAMPSRSYSVRTGTGGTTARDWSGFRWSPVLAGVVTAIALQLLLTVLGMAIGVSVAEPRDPGTNASAFGIAAGVWWLITGTLSLLVGGIVLGRAWGRHHGMLLHLHTIAMWAVVAIFGFFVIWSGAGMVSETASPMAAIVGQQAMSSQSGAGTGIGTDLIDDPARAQAALVQATDAAQTAAWWSVVGLIIGIGASVVGGLIGARSENDNESAPVTAA